MLGTGERVRLIGVNTPETVHPKKAVEAGLVESLAHPGGNVTGLTLLSRELGGKRLELLKEAVTKVARVAVLYNPATVGIVPEVKEVLPVAARALGLTVRSWKYEMRTVSSEYSLR